MNAQTKKLILKNIEADVALEAQVQDLLAQVRNIREQQQEARWNVLQAAQDAGRSAIVPAQVFTYTDPKTGLKVNRTHKSGSYNFLKDGRNCSYFGKLNRSENVVTIVAKGLHPRAGTQADQDVDSF